MDTIHDLGGVEGFGAIDTKAPGFTHDWERRSWAIAKNTTASSGTLDFWRHSLERMEPATYLSISYFEKWCLNNMTQFILAGDFTLEEVLSGRTEKSDQPNPPSGLEGARARLKANEVFFDRQIDAPPLFAVGDVVLTKEHIDARHTRLARYARGKSGTILAHHGAHVFADAAAAGDERAEHLYTVEFSARTLWGNSANPRDSVTLDLWESYCVRP